MSPAPPLLHHLAEGIHGIACAHHVEVDNMLGVGLIGRSTCRVDEVHHGAEFCRLLGKSLHALFLQGVHHHRLHVVAATAEIVAHALQRLLADVAQKNLLASCDTAHDGCSHTSGTQERHHFLHVVSVENHSLYFFILNFYLFLLQRYNKSTLCSYPDCRQIFKYCRRFIIGGIGDADIWSRPGKT